MKFSLFAIAFAALATTGLAAKDVTMETATNQVEPETPQRALREAILTEGNNVAGTPELIEPEVKDNKRDLNEGKPGKKNRGLKKEYSGQGCRFCCDDDYHC